MRDMEYLTEKDLPYFEEKAKKGEAVIIYIDPDALLEAEEAVGEFLELEEQRRKDKAVISEEDLMGFLEDNHLLLSEEAKKSEKLIRENKEMQDTIDKMEKTLENMRERDKRPVEKIMTVIATCSQSSGRQSVTGSLMMRSGWSRIRTCRRKKEKNCMKRLSSEGSERQ